MIGLASRKTNCSGFSCQRNCHASKVEMDFIWIPLKLDEDRLKHTWCRIDRSECFCVLFDINAKRVLVAYGKGLGLLFSCNAVIVDEWKLLLLFGFAIKFRVSNIYTN